MGTIESGVCHVGDKEIKSSGYGEKVRLKLKDVEEKVTFLLLLIIIF